MPPDGPLLLDIRGAAGRLAISPRHCQGLVYSGQLRSVRIGRCRRILVSELERFVTELAEGDAVLPLELGGGDRGPSTARKSA
jgi:excisionase family DNA binding protein